MNKFIRLSSFVSLVALCTPLMAGENLLGYVKGAEPLPQGEKESYFIFTNRNDKGIGHYHATDAKAEFEYGVSNKFTVSAGLKAMSLDTSDIIIDAYIPEDRNMSYKFSGLETELKYNFLSPALKPIGLSGMFGIDYGTVDPHSGQDKTTLSVDSTLALQKFLLEGQMIWLGNIGMEATYAKRYSINNLPPGFEWPTKPEMEIEWKFGTGLSYRFAPGWFIGAETVYETEFETEVGQERWSVFAGPSLHYGGQEWWATLTYFDQLEGGGELVQADDSLHLIEKTKNELRLKIGFNI